MAFVLVLNVWNGCNNNNIVNRLKQDVSCKVLFNVGTNELIMQEMLLKNSEEASKALKASQENFPNLGLFQSEQ
jgi:hypothetical protein